MCKHLLELTTNNSMSSNKSQQNKYKIILDKSVKYI